MIKNNIFRSIGVFLAAGIVLISCSDDVDGPDTISMLRHDWKITNITTPKFGQPATDSTIFKACMTDDIIQFSNTGFDFKDGAVTCDSSIFHYAKGSWAYKQSGDSILLSTLTPATYTSWKILLLNDSVLQVRYTDSVNPASKISKTISLKH